MPKIKCRYIACIHNTNDCEAVNKDLFGECTCPDEVVLTDAPKCGECGCESEGMDCENFEFKPKFIKR